MSQGLFRNWKLAALWAVGISASVAAFFAEGGGHEQFEESAQQIRDKRNPARQAGAATAAASTPAPAATPSSAPEPEEPAFGEPAEDTPVEEEAGTAQAPEAPGEDQADQVS